VPSKTASLAYVTAKKERAPLLERVQTAEFGAEPLFRHEHFLHERLSIYFKAVEIDA
jgi:hypothetical protein